MSLDLVPSRRGKISHCPRFVSSRLRPECVSFSSPFFPSPRYLEKSRRASRLCVPSLRFVELGSHLDSWKSPHSYGVLIPSYPATFPFSGNPKVCSVDSLTAVSLT